MPKFTNVLVKPDGALDPMTEVLRVTRDKKTGHVDGLEFFQGFFDADLDEQNRHLEGLLEVCKSAPGRRPWPQGI